MEIHCPQCQGKIILDGELSPDGFRCGECGSTFVRSEKTVSFVPAGAEHEITFVPGDGQTSAEGLPAFSDYEVIEEIARGGMGVVYKARQRSLNRIVALKMIRSGELANPEEVARFRTEAEAAGQLDHSGIVPVYDVGEHDGRHFYSMAFVEGQSLHEKVNNDGPLPPKRAAEMLKTVAEAVQFGHDRGITNRDIKPQNVLLDQSESPRITDFGLARHGDSEMTVAGQIMGTPSYMPPEQAEGRSDDVGPASDVYSLGATLYYVLTGRPPFRAASATETLRQVVQTEAVLPRRLNPDIPQDLETICLRCLRKERAGRYSSAGALAEDLRRFLDGVPVKARPVGRIEAAWLWCRRKPTTAGLLAMVLLLFIGVFGGALWYVNDRGERRAEEVRQETLQAQRVLQLEQQIEAAIGNANLLREKSWALTERPTEWEAMLASARAEYSQAISLVDQEPRRIAPALRTRLEELGRELDADERDQQFAARFEEIYLESAEPDVEELEQLVADNEDSVRELRESFAIIGLDPGVTPITDAVQRLLARPVPIQLTWIGVLETYLSAIPSSETVVGDWLQQVLRTADSNTWRNDVRGAMVEANGGELRRLAAEGDVAAHPTMLLMQLGLKLLELGFEDESLSLLIRLHSIHPDDFWLNKALGDHLMQAQVGQYGGEPGDEALRRPEQAARYYYAALAVRPNTVTIWLNLGVALLDADDSVGAEAAYRRAIALNHDFAWAHGNLGYVLTEQNRLDEAEECYRQAIRLRPGVPDFWSGLGLLLYRRSDLDGAMHAYEMTVKLDPRDVDGLLRLGLALQDAGDLLASVSVLQQAARLAPDNSLIHASVLALHAYLGDIAVFQAASQRMFDGIAGSAGREDVARLLMAHVIVPGVARREQLEILQQMAQSSTDDYGWLQLLTQYRLGEEPATLPRLDEADIEIMPANSRICHDLTLALHQIRMDRKDEVLESIGRARSVQQTHGGESLMWPPWEPVPTLWREVSKAVDAEGIEVTIPKLAPEYEGFLSAVISRFRRDVERDVGSLPARLNLGNALVLAGDVDAGIAEFRDAALRHPEHARPHARLGHAYLRRGQDGDLDLSITAFQNAVELDPEDLLAVRGLGAAYLESGALPKAIGAYRQRATLEPFPFRVSYELAAMLKYTGQDDEYRELCQSMLADLKRPDRGGHQVLMAHLFFPGADVNDQVLDLAKEHADGGNPITVRMLGLAHYRRGNDDEARRLLEPAAVVAERLAPNSGIVSLLTLALVELRTRRQSEARGLISRARTIQEDSPDDSSSLDRKPWGVIPSLWREVQAAMEEVGIDEPIPKLPPTYAESLTIGFHSGDSS